MSEEISDKEKVRLICRNFYVQPEVKKEGEKNEELRDN